MHKRLLRRRIMERHHGYVFAALFTVLIGCSAPPSQIEWREGDFESILVAGQQSGKKIFVYLYADWCGYCSYMSENVLNQSDIVKEIDSFLIPYRVESGSPESLKIRQIYTVSSYPTFLFLNPDGSEIDRYIGKGEHEEFMNELRIVKKNMYTVSYYQDQLTRNPEDPELLYKIFRKFAERSDSTNLLMYYNRIRKADRPFFNTHREQMDTALSQAYFASKRYSDAISVGTGAVNVLLDSLKRNYKFLAQCHSQTGNRAEVYRIYSVLVSLFPEDPESYLNIVKLAITDPSYTRQGLEAAETGLGLTKGGSETRADFLYYSARLNETSGNRIKAAAYIMEALGIKEKPAYRTFHDSLAAENGETEEAEPFVEFSPRQWDFGTISQGLKAETDLLIWNRGIEPLQVDIISTCDCLSASPGRTVISPGQKGLIGLSYESGDESGPIERLYIIHTNAEGFEETAFYVNGTVKE